MRPQKQTPLVIVLQDVSVGYGHTAILENISFSVAEGEILTLLGGSGCGKSTLMRNMIGLNRPLSGSGSRRG